MLRRYLAIALFCGATAFTGCATPGFRFEIIQPPVLLGGTQSIVQSTSGSVALQPNASFVSPMGMPATMAYPTVATMLPTTAPINPTLMPRDTCTLEDVCRRIQALESVRPSLVPAPGPERLPFPAPKATVPVPPMPPAPPGPCGG